MEAPKPEIRIFYNVWCEGGTHYVRVNVLRSCGPNSTIQQVDEDETFTVKSFLHMHFNPTKVYQDTVKRIKEFDRRCCSRPVEATTTADISEHPSLYAGTDFAKSGYIILVKWLRSCFFPAQRKPGHWSFSAWHRGPDLRRASFHSSKEAIIPDTTYRSDIDANTYRPSSNSKGDTKYRMSTANLSAPNYAASDAMLPLAQTTQKHANRITGASLPEHITGVVAVGSFYSTCEGVYGCQVIVLTRSDSVRLLQRVDFGALVEYERIARQLRAIIGDSVFDQLSQLEQKRIDVRDPVYRGLVPEEGLQVKVGEALPLEQCPPILQAYVKSVVSI